MLGGFLGAGKTTTILRLAQFIQRQGLRPGLITNDQAEGLVDTALLEELNLPVREIVGGCFCCRSNTLVEALNELENGVDNLVPQNLTREKVASLPLARAAVATARGNTTNGNSKRPTVFIAEPVGSCTDLVATVTLPLEQIYHKGFVMAPYAVLVDPLRAEQVLGLRYSPHNALPEKAHSEPSEAHIDNYKAKYEAGKRPSKRDRVRALVGVPVSKGGETARAITNEEAQHIVSIQNEMAKEIARIGALRSSDSSQAPQNNQLRSGFSDEVNYIYMKQLEEAEIIVINKIDVVSPARLARLKQAIAAEFPETRIMEIGSRAGVNMDQLFLALTTERGNIRKVMNVDYNRYGTGEAKLGWVNGSYTLEMRSEDPVGRLKTPNGKLMVENLKAKKKRTIVGTGLDVDSWLFGLAEGVQGRLLKRGVEIAHLKVTFGKPGKLAAVQLVHSHSRPEFTAQLRRPLSEGELRINLRAEADPDLLLSDVLQTLVESVEQVAGLQILTGVSNHFRPSQPNPVHRLNSVKAPE